MYTSKRISLGSITRANGDFQRKRFFLTKDSDALVVLREATIDSDFPTLFSFYVLLVEMPNTSHSPPPSHNHLIKLLYVL